MVDIIGTGQESPQKYCVALRADMDALSLTELNTELPYISVNENAAHMCGHDSHMAMLLSAAHVFI